MSAGAEGLGAGSTGLSGGSSGGLWAGPAGGGAGGFWKGSSAYSAKPIRYFNGEIRIIATDLSSNAFGEDWGHTRSWSNLLRANYGGPYGVNWFVKELPILVNDVAENALALIGIVQETLWFDEDGTSYLPRFFVKDTLVHDAGGMKFIHTDTKGKRTEFYDFTVSDGLRGRFIRSIDPHGGTNHIKEAHCDVNYQLESVTQSVSGIGSVGYLYEYYSRSGIDINRIKSVTLQVDSVNVRRAEFVYYNYTEDNGLIGDLKLVTVQTWKTPCPSGSAAWTDMQKTHYRYYKADASPGFARGLKFVVGPEAFARLVAASINPLTASDSTIDDYADHYFEYDSARRVVKEVVNGGLMTYTYAYTPSLNTAGYNNWSMKTTETLPDANENIVYTNYVGQVMLKILKSGSDEWYEYFQYDSNGRPVLQANSFAIASYTEGTPGLVTLKTSDGFLALTEFYANNASGTGEAPGLQRYQKIKKGTSGSAITLTETLYSTRETTDGTKTYHVWKNIGYPNEAGTGAFTTEYSYTWFSDTHQMDEITITLPTVPTTQNGTNTTDTQKLKYSVYGQLLWSRDERGYITGLTYDLLNGGASQRIDDAAIGASPPWTPVSGTRLNLVTNFTYDSLGRLTQELGPEHEIDLSGAATDIRRAHWFVYHDDTHEVWAASGYASGSGFSTFTLVQPAHIARFDHRDIRIAEVEATRASGTSGKLDRCDTFAQSSWTRWTQFHFDNNNRMDWERVYFDIPSSGAGTSGTNYDETQFGYNSMSMRNKVKSPGGTITKTTYLPNGWVSAIHIGTDDSGGGTDNMRLIEQRQYDGNSDGGDGNLTQLTRYVNGTSGTERVTTFAYDWRNRRISAESPIAFYESYSSDNFDRTLTTERHKSSDDSLGWKTENNFDSRGRIFRTVRQGTDGASGNSLEENVWFDKAGNLVQRQLVGSSAFDLMTYDSLNRLSIRYLAYGPGNLSGDVVMQQNEMTYDEQGTLVFQVTRERFHDAAASQTGPLTSPGGSNPKARASYAANYPDPLGRIINVADYGTHGGSAVTRPSTCPARANDILVTTTDYNDRGEAWQVTDPQATVKRSEFDDADRLTKTIENYRSSGSGSDINKTTDSTYNADGKLATLTAINSGTGNQVTTYVYGTTLSDSDVASSQLLRAVIYPDSTDSPNPLSGTDHVEYGYNRLGERKQMKDQREVIHNYDYDKLGRLTDDRVTLPSGSAVNGAILRISRTYDFRGMLLSITGYDAATSGTIKNQCAFTYNEFAQLIKDEQAHDAAVTSGTPAVEYAYEDGTGNTIRPTSLTYPGGQTTRRVITYNYGASASISDKLSRILGLVDNKTGTTPVAQYEYVGIGRTAQINFDTVDSGAGTPGVKFTWIKQGSESPTDGGDRYTGWDRFGRAIDLRWIKNSSGNQLERIKHGYDRASNRLYRKNVVVTTGDEQDELYAYDGLYQLANFQRGDLNTGHSAMTALAMEQAIAFDPSGNWSSYTMNSGAPQTRAHNKANEITQIDSSSSLLAQDTAGNMTKVPKPGSWSAAYDLTYDAWNRLVKVMDGGTTVAEYGYDGLNRRMTKKIGSDTRHFYYTDEWQIIEERLNTSTDAQQQFVWGIRYLDDLILRDRDTNNDGSMDERLYVIQDYFQPTAVMNTNGAVQERYGYEAFGTSRVMTPSYGSRNPSNYDWETRYGAYRWDEETKLSQARNRYLHSSLGRWLTRDPIGYKDGSNLYWYCHNTPINCVDGSGKKGKKGVWGCICGILGIGAGCKKTPPKPPGPPSTGCAGSPEVKNAVEKIAKCDSDDGTGGGECAIYCDCLASSSGIVLSKCVDKCESEYGAKC